MDLNIPLVSESECSLLPADVQSLVKKLGDDKITVLPNGKVRILLTNIDLPPETSVIEKYLKNNKKYKRAVQQQAFNINQPQFKYIVPHNTLKNRLYCTLTKTTVNNIPEEVYRHVHGKRYMKAMEKFHKRQQRKMLREERIKKRKAAMMDEDCADGIENRLGSVLEDESISTDHESDDLASNADESGSESENDGEFDASNIDSQSDDDLYFHGRNSLVNGNDIDDIEVNGKEEKKAFEHARVHSSKKSAHRSTNKKAKC